MDLFHQTIDKNTNLLSKDGVVNYYGRIFNDEESKHYFNRLLACIEWKQDRVILFGKKITTKRKVAWYGDRPYQYTYSNIPKLALPWIPELLKIKQTVEHESGEFFNSCLLNLYQSGEEGMGWHSDDEPDLKKQGAIASVSFGAERKFVFKHKGSKEKSGLYLENGSLLLMKETTQRFWWHTLPKSKEVKNRRINLTFRTIVN